MNDQTKPPTSKRRLSPHTLASSAMTALASVRALATGARADESPFAYTYLTEVLPAGEAIELEQWLTWKHKKPQETFDQFSGSHGIRVRLHPSFSGSLHPQL